MLPSKKFYLFGSPIQASPSPAMHSAAFKVSSSNAVIDFDRFCVLTHLHVLDIRAVLSRRTHPPHEQHRSVSHEYAVVTLLLTAVQKLSRECDHTHTTFRYSALC
jgi:hypothetical protein